MDNVPEINQSPEQPSVPSHWQFEERGEDGLEILALDEKNGHLVTTFPPGVRYERSSNPEWFSEYFFHKNGQPLDKRFIRELGLDGVLCTGSGMTKWREEGCNHNLYVPSWLLDNVAVDKIKGIAGILDINIHFEGGFFRTSQDDEGKIDQIDTAYFRFLNDRLLHVALFDSFITGESSRFYVSLWLKEKKRSGRDEVTEGDYELHIDPEDKPNIRHNEKNEVFFLNNNGEKLFFVQWSIGNEEDKAGKEVSHLKFSQTHLPTGTVKTLRVPTSIDVCGLIEPAFSKPPYPKDEKGNLVVPWRDIDRLVGASLSYSYPPQRLQR